VVSLNLSFVLSHHDSCLHTSTVRNLLGRYGLGGHAHTIKLSSLSGGQKARVVFAGISLTKPHILFLDEPTNHLVRVTVFASFGTFVFFFTRFRDYVCVGGFCIFFHSLRRITSPLTR
jgi:ABC-type uncharacterized transport system YnjBCD ATPase subunit